MYFDYLNKQIYIYFYIQGIKCKPDRCLECLDSYYTTEFGKCEMCYGDPTKFYTPF